MEKVILHLDMDAFFSSVEQLSDPRLIGKPVIVCGDPHRRSVVATASYEARKYGLRSGMPIGEARRLCPQGIYITGNPRKYIYTSIRILGILREFTSLVEPFSVDEAFLEFRDLTLDEAVEKARRIKRRIRKDLGLTSSVGVAENKIRAKMASDLEKPDGLSVIEPGGFLNRFGDRPVRVLWGIGEKTQARLRSMGIVRVSELAAFSEDGLRRVFGEYGTYLKMTANGLDDSRVVPYYEGIRPKSIGHEHTLPDDMHDRAELLSYLLRLSEKVGRRMRKEGVLGDTVTVKIRFSDFKTITRQKKLDQKTDRDDILFQTSRRLFLAHHDGEKVRLIGVSASGLVPGREASVDPMFTDDIRQKLCLEVSDSIRDRFGESAIIRGGGIRP
jgi:DNA polymerase-4